MRNIRFKAEKSAHELNVYKMVWRQYSLVGDARQRYESNFSEALAVSVNRERKRMLGCARIMYYLEACRSDKLFTSLKHAEMHTANAFLHNKVARRYPLFIRYVHKVASLLTYSKGS